MAPIALISVSDKQGLVPLAKSLTKEHGFEIISSGGTAKLLESENIPVIRVSDYTGFPEILGGRVKTLHPLIHGGILANHEDPKHKKDLVAHHINPIDLVIVNLYPFKETIANPDVSWSDAIENIDIGGPAMIRAAAKNQSSVSVLTSPNQYSLFLEALNSNKLSEEFKRKLALEAFEHTASYDIAISKWISQRTQSKESPLLEDLPIKQKLRYGENPHQKAIWYSSDKKGWGNLKQIQGKELSMNNLIDLEAALNTVKEFGYQSPNINNSIQNAAVVIKHTNPCGAAIGDSLNEAIKRALDGDRVSAFGGIVALNSSVDYSTAKELENIFLECIVAPSFDEDSKKILSKKKNLRLLELDANAIESSEKTNKRSILGGLLIQDKDDNPINESDWEIATKISPTNQEYLDLKFAWKIVKHIKSNAIVIASEGKSLGVGAGQMNRVGSAQIALDAAGLEAKGSVLASDGFFPFADTIHLASKYGISAIIQPGGSIRDNESIQACDQLGLKMILTGRRHFSH